MSRPVGFGVIGLGLISRAHIHGLLQAQSDARVVAVCDNNEAVVLKVASELGARAYLNYTDLLADPEVEAVDLPLPHHLHFGVAKAALEHGKHVIVEKPMAPSSAECDTLIAEAHARGLKLSVAENAPFVAAYVPVRHLIESRALGSIRLVRTLISGSEIERLTDTSNWKGRRDGTIGGAILDAGPHSFQLLKWLFGAIVNVQAVANRLVSVSEVEDNAIVTGRLESGALFSCEFTFTAEVPWSERLEVYGSEGTVIVDQLLDPPTVHYRGRHDYRGVELNGACYSPDKVEHDPGGWKFHSIAAGLEAFAHAVATDTRPPVDPLDGADTIRVVEAAYRSIDLGGVSVGVESASMKKRETI